MTANVVVHADSPNVSWICEKSQGMTSTRGLVVLGMHRSGTSAVTAALRAMGAYVGTQEELTPVYPENPRGFEERRDARQLCDQLLHSVGADWWKIADFDVSRVSDATRGELEGQFQALADRLCAHPVWALKEPRLCLLWPLFAPWLTDVVPIQVIRHPLAVARSLRRRNGLPMRVGQALWARYNMAVDDYPWPQKPLRIHYEALIQHPVETLSALAESLKAVGVLGLTPSRAATVVESGLQHESGQESDAWWLPECHKYWRGLQRGETFHVIRKSLDSVLAEFEQQDAELQQQLRASANPPATEYQYKQALLRARLNQCLVEADELAEKIGFSNDCQPASSGQMRTPSQHSNKGKKMSNASKIALWAPPDWDASPLAVWLSAAGCSVLPTSEVEGPESLLAQLNQNAACKALVVVHVPKVQLAAALKAGQALDRALEDWVQSTKTVLAVVRRHRKRIVLIQLQSGCSDASKLQVSLTKHFGLESPSASLSLPEAASMPAMLRVLAQRLIESALGSRTLLAELNASTLFNTDGGGSESDLIRMAHQDFLASVDERAHLSAQNDQLQDELKQAEQLAQQASAQVADLTRSKQARSDSQKLIKQVHFLEERLAHYHLENARLSAAEREVERLNRKLGFQQRRLNYVESSVSWKLTRPLRGVMKLLRGNKTADSSSDGRSRS
ncbi:sulfotransferase family protein [Wenzhouxiangella limi]|uniref:Sulfotransferase family protein n=1 Tax=Wenzhouxiangella limi TaxID=2707351 RepID=A0A845V225_9GAMM|nr:sulfotransferase [Wenzhouxiangella limi]NDY96310.1 hypothetical protein [Wenzhouxiangella limi]